MAVYRTKRGKVYWMDFVFAGQRIQESTRTASKSLAKKVEQKRRRDLEEGAAGVRRYQPPRLLAMAAADWLTLRRPTAAPRTMEVYTLCLRHVVPALGDRLLQEIAGGDIARYQQRRLAEGASARRVNLEVGVVRSILKRARLWAEIQPDVKMLAEPEGPGVAMTRDQASRLLEECARSFSRTLYPFVVLAMETGARRNVIRTLQWKRVDFGSRCLTWGKDKTPAGTGRVVPLSQRAFAVLEQWAACFPNRQPDHYVFPAEKVAGIGRRGPQGRREEAQFAEGRSYATDPARPIGTVTTAWETARRRAGVRVRFHDLRHMAASRMLDAGVSLPKVAKILGWAPGTMAQMAARYGHFRLEELRAAVETISGQEAARTAPHPLNFPLNSAAGKSSGIAN